MRGENSPVVSACCLSGGASTLPVGAGWRKSSQTSQHHLPRIEPLPGMIRNGVSCPSWSNSAALDESQGKREPWVYGFTNPNGGPCCSSNAIDSACSHMDLVYFKNIFDVGL